MFWHIVDGLRVSFHWAMFDFIRLLECKLKPCFHLLPEGRPPFAPCLCWRGGNQQFGDGLQICTSALGGPWVLLEEVLLGL